MYILLHGCNSMIKKLFYICIIYFAQTYIYAEEKLKLDYIEVPKYRSINQDGIYGDVLCYSKKEPFGDQHGRPTNVHETAHQICSEIRNEYSTKYGYKINAYYDKNGLVLFIKDIDKLKIRQVANFIPEKLRSYRFKLYFIDQLIYWDDCTSYIMDEWIAYILGAECAVDDYYRLNKKEPADCVSGSLEFSIYTIGLYMAVKDLNPEYIKNNPQFKDTIKYYLTRASHVFHKGKDIFKSEKQENQFRVLLEDESALEYRKLLESEFRKAFLTGE